MTPRVREPEAAGLKRPPGRILPGRFFAGDTLATARALLGCLLARREEDGSWSAGRIVETEAYVGEDDPACHAAAGLTPRTRVMYGPPGRAYVYFTYGMHHLLNVVTGPEGFPAAVLIRALRPVGGIAAMAARRGRTRIEDIASGPSKLCQALGIDLRWNGTPLRGEDLVLTRDGETPERVAHGPRVGIRKGAGRPWRFWVEGDPNVSPARPGPPRGRRGEGGS